MSDSFEVIAAKLAENETNLSELYALFAETFPEDAALWTELSHDEQRHAAWITAVSQSAAQGGTVPLPSAAVRREAIETMIRYTRSVAERCRKGEMTRVQAHALACDFENSMLENRLFSALSAGAAESRSLVEDLIDDTARHRQRIRSALATLRAPDRP